jgi:hypothetical protein
MIDTDIIVAHPSLFDRLDRPPPGIGDSDPSDLDRLAASLDYLTLCCCGPATNESDLHPTHEAVAEREQFLVRAVPTAGEQF